MAARRCVTRWPAPGGSPTDGRGTHRHCRTLGSAVAPRHVGGAPDGHWPPSLRTFGVLFALPALLTVRREVTLAAAALVATYTFDGLWTAIAMVTACCVLAERYPALLSRIPHRTQIPSMADDEAPPAAWIDRRRALLGLAGMAAVVAAFAVARSAPDVWAVDAHRNLAGAEALLRGAYGSVDGYLYSPIAAAITVPALAIPTDVAVVDLPARADPPPGGRTLIAGRSLPRADRVLVVISVLAFLPLVYDLELGNVTTLVLAGIVVVTRGCLTAPPLEFLWGSCSRPHRSLSSSPSCCGWPGPARSSWGQRDLSRRDDGRRSCRARVSTATEVGRDPQGPGVPEQRAGDQPSVWAWPLPVALAAAPARRRLVLALRNGYWLASWPRRAWACWSRHTRSIYAAGSSPPWCLQSLAPRRAGRSPSRSRRRSASWWRFRSWVAAAMALAAWSRETAGRDRPARSRCGA